MGQKAGGEAGRSFSDDLKGDAMKIVCQSGIGHNTEIYDDDGRDLGAMLHCRKATVVLEVGSPVVATLECFSKVDLDLGNVTIKTVSVVPKESSVWLALWWDVLSGSRRTRRLIKKALDDYERGCK